MEDLKGVALKAADLKTADPRTADPKTMDTKEVDTRKVDLKAAGSNNILTSQAKAMGTRNHPTGDRILT